MSSKRAVAIYRSELLPFSETFIARQAEALTRFEPTLVGKWGVPEGLDVTHLSPVVAHDRRPSGWRGREPFPLPAPRSLRSPLRQRGVELVHAHFGPDGMAASSLSRSLGVPLLITFHGYDAARSTSVREGPHRWLYGALIPRLVNRTARTTIAVSEHVRHLLIERGCDPARITTHYIGIQTGHFEQRSTGARPPTVLAIGRFVEKKGFEHLIRAFPAVRSRIPDARLVLVGDGMLRSRLETLAAGVPGIEIRRRATPDEIRSLLEHAAVLAVPSVTAADGDTEGLPIVLLEGMSTGMPIVATRHAGIPEAIVDGTSGWLVAERDEHALSTALLEALSNRPEADRRAAAAAARAREKFDLATQTRALEKIYEQAIEQHHSGRLR
ncbi:MAG: glycosyltransferase [Patulibacter sp.]